MIDIEKLATNCGSVSDDKYNDRTTWEFDKTALKQFAEAYHKAMCEVEASSTEAIVLRPPLKRLDEDRIDEIFNSYSDEQGYVAIDDWHLLTNAIMDEMERINK